MEEIPLEVEVAKAKSAAERATINNRRSQSPVSSRRRRRDRQRQRQAGAKKNEQERVQQNEAREAEKSAAPTLPVCSWSHFYFPGLAKEVPEHCACWILGWRPVQLAFPEYSHSRSDPDDCGCEEIVGALLRFATVQCAREEGFPAHWLASESTMREVRRFSEESSAQQFRFSEGMSFRVHEFVDLPLRVRKFNFSVACISLLLIVWYWIPSPYDFSAFLFYDINVPVEGRHRLQLAIYNMLMIFLCVSYPLAFLFFAYRAYLFMSKSHDCTYTIVHFYETRVAPYTPSDFPLSDLRNRSANFAGNPMMPRYVCIDYRSQVVKGMLFQQSIHQNGPRVWAPSGLVLPEVPSFSSDPVGWVLRHVQDIFMCDLTDLDGANRLGIDSWRPFVPLGAGKASEQFAAQVWSGMASFTTRAHWQLLRHIEARVSNNTHVNLDAMTAMFDQIHWNSLVLAVAYAYHCRQTAGLRDYRFVAEQVS